MQYIDLDTSLPSELYNQHASSWINDSFNVDDNDVFNSTWSCPPTKPVRRRHNSEHPQMNYVPIQAVFQFPPFPVVQLPRLPLDPNNPAMPISRDQLLTPAALQGLPVYGYKQYRPRSYSDSVHSRMMISMNMGERMNFLQPVQYSHYQRRIQMSSMSLGTFYEQPRTRSGRSSRHNSTNSSDNECGYCRSVGLPIQGHNKYACPALAALSPCAICGAEGVDNHTASHCPNAEKELLQLKPEYLNHSLRRQRLRLNAVAAATGSD